MIGFFEFGIIFSILFSLPLIICYLWVIKICLFSDKDKSIVYNHHLFDLITHYDLLSKFSEYMKEKTTCAVLLFLGNIYFIIINILFIFVSLFLLFIALIFYLISLVSATKYLLWFVIGIGVTNIINFIIKLIAEIVYKKK